MAYLRMVVLTKRWPYSEETFLRTFAAQRFVDEDLLRVDAQPARFALARHVDHQQHQIGMRYFVDAERPVKQNIKKRTIINQLL